MTMVMTIVLTPDHAKFEDLDIEAIYVFEVVNMPITVWWIAPGSRCIKSRQMTH